MPSIGERLLFPIAKRWIAGYELEDAIKAAKDANKRKFFALVNRLGEHTPDSKRVQEYAQIYLDLPDRLEKEGIDGTISVKPSQLGLAIRVSLFKDNLSQIVERTEKVGRYLWVDMENSPYTEDTLQVYMTLLKDHPKMGVCLQANLKRTEKDLSSLLAIGGKIRLVKGAYPEDPNIAFKGRRAVDSNYINLLKILFAEGDNFVVATHDSKLLEEAQRLGEENHKNFEFDLLKGIRDDVKIELVNKGYRVGEYIPYGPEWYNYSKRRMRERKRNILLLARSLFG